MSKLLFVSVACFGLALCQSVLGAGSTIADPDYKAMDVLVKNCAGCHNSADHPGALFLNQARLSEPETLKRITKLIETSQMPPAHRDFRKTSDGKTLLKWLKSQRTK